MCIIGCCQNAWPDLGDVKSYVLPPLSGVAWFAPWGGWSSGGERLLRIMRMSVSNNLVDRLDAISDAILAQSPTVGKGYDL